MSDAPGKWQLVRALAEFLRNNGGASCVDIDCDDVEQVASELFDILTRADLAPDAAYVGALREALTEIMDAESYVKRESFSGNSGYVDITHYSETGEIARAALAATPQAAPVRVVTVEQLEQWMSYTSQHGGSANCLKEIRAIIAGQP